MTVSSHDVRTLSAGAGPGVPLPAAEVDRITAVLNRSGTPRSAAHLRDDTGPADSLGRP